MKKTLIALLLFIAPALGAQTIPGPIPQSVYTTPSYIGGGTAATPVYVPKGTVDPTVSTYGAKFDVHWGTVPTFTNTSNVVTCTDCNFNSTDILGRAYAVVGQIVWGTTATNDLTTATSTLTTPECVIQSIDSNTQIHMGTIGAIGTACNAIASTTGTGYLLWGDLDSASSTQTQSTANDPLLNAWTAAFTACARFQMPSGATFVEQAEFTTYLTTQTCGANNSLTSMRFGFTIAGQGPFSTYIIPTPNFKTATCTGPNGAGSTCLISLPNAYLTGFQIFGGGNSACGAGFNGKTLTQSTGASPGLNMRVVNVMMFGFCGNQAGVTGYKIGSGAGPTISGGDTYDLWVENYGINSVASDPGAAGVIEWHGGDFWSGNGKALEIVSGTLKSNLSFDGTQAAGQTTVTLDQNTTYYSTDDIMQQAGGAAAYINMTNTGTVVHIKGLTENGGTNNTPVFCTASSTCTAYVVDSQLNSGVARSFYADTSSTLTVYDIGGNTLIAGNGPGTLNWYGKGNGDTIRANCTGVATASSTLGLYGTGSNETLGTCTSTTIGTGIVMQNAGNLINLVVKATAGGVNASSGVVTVLKNGAGTTITCTTGTSTGCNDGAHTVAYAVGDRISVQFTTQTAETLAGVNAIVVAN